MTPQEQWKAVDRYFNDLLIGPDEALDTALRDSAAAGLPNISVSANQGKLLHLLALVRGARHILEIGTLGGYSTIWLARALPRDGHLITLEADEKHANVARKNIERAGLGDRVELVLGARLGNVARDRGESRAPEARAVRPRFIDADKTSTAEYFQWSLKLSRRGSLIITDNVVRSGGVIDPDSADASVQGVRRFNAMLAAEKRVTATAIQTVGSKGYDGFAIALVVADGSPLHRSGSVRE
jgi:predicted O-methyltransferase YrrM